MNTRLWLILLAVLVGLRPALAVGIGTARAEEVRKVDGSATIYLSVEGTTVFETATTLAVEDGHIGDLQAYYLIVPPDGNVKNAKKVYSEHIFRGPLKPGVARDSYGPTGGFLKGTSICAGWWDPTGKITIPGFPCERIPV